MAMFQLRLVRVTTNTGDGDVLTETSESNHKHGVVTGSNLDGDVVTKSNRNYGVVTGSNQDGDVVTGSNRNYGVATGSNQDGDVVTGSNQKWRCCNWE